MQERKREWKNLCKRERVKQQDTEKVIENEVEGRES